MEWSGLEARQCLELLSWKVDVEWCGDLFSKTFTNSCHASSGLDWDTLATSLGLVTKLPLSSSKPTFGHLKLSGVVVLVSLGSYLCYKLYKVWLYQPSAINPVSTSRGNDGSPPSRPSFVKGTSSFSYHFNELDPNSSTSIKDFLNVETRYFGPMGLKKEDSEKYYSGNEYESSHLPENMVQSVGSKKRIMRHKSLTPPSAHHHRGWLSHKMHTVGPNSQACNGGKSPGNSVSTSSTGSSPLSHRPHHSLSRDFSFDSLGLFNNSCRQSSLDSMCSELSFDMPSFTEQAAENITLARLDKLQEEIDQIKSNCQMIDEEFGSVKCNRNLPGLSDLMETTDPHNIDEELTEQDIIRHQSAKACFKGLYSLTTINQSVSMDLSSDEDSINTNKPCVLTQLTEEELVPSLEWDDQNNWTPTQLPEEEISQTNIGSRVDIMSYAQEEWNSNTLKANNILRGYREIVESLQYRFIRKVRRDSYCVLRCAAFQVLAQGLQIPNSASTLARLSNVHNIEQWQFNSLPHCGTNIIRKMEICLQSLDNISALCQINESCMNREKLLHNLFNRDPTLDLHVMEAVKLHMMATALELDEAKSKGQKVPFFYTCLSARDISDMPLHVMNNQSVQVENSGELEQVDVLLLGYTLGVSVKVVRPTAYGTRKFICFYPEENVNSWPEIALLTEDDCHYNILCI